MTCGIYAITHKESGKMYIGQSINIERRFKQHCIQPNKGSYIDNAIKKHGKETFTFKTLLECDKSQLDDEEHAFIKLYGTYKNGYNLTWGGDMKEHGNPMNNPLFAKKNADARRGKPLSEIHRENLGKSRNTTGFYRVSKQKDKRVVQGFSYRYIYPIENGHNGKKRKIMSNDILKLEERVVAQGLEWKVLNEVLALKTIEESSMLNSKRAKQHATGIYRVIKHFDKTLKQGFDWRYQDFRDNKVVYISSVNPSDLKERVLNKGFDWIVVNEDKARECGLL